MKRALLLLLVLLVACEGVDRPEPPQVAPPQGVSATTSAYHVELSWRESARALGYNVYRSESAEIEITPSNRRNATLVAVLSFTDEEVTSGMTYYYVVTAVGPDRESSASNEVRATLDEEVPPVENLEVKPGDGEVTLSWEASHGAAGYHIYRSEAPDVEADAANRQNAVLYGLTHYTDRSVSSGVTYYYAVTAVDADGRESALSQVVSATGNRAPIVSAGEDQDVSLPNASVTLEGTAEDDGFPDPPGMLTFLWSEVSGPAEVVFADPTALETTASFSAPGDYVLRLSADDGALTSSDEVTITVAEAPPPLTRLSWSAAAPAPLALSEAQGAAVGGELYVFGGYSSWEPFLTTTASYAYNSATNSWRELASMPVPWTHAGAVVDGNDIYLAGGYLNTNDNRPRHEIPDGEEEILRYNIVDNMWYRNELPPLPERRGAGGFAMLNRHLHFFGGHDPLRNGKTDHWALSLDAPQEGWQPRAPLPDDRNHLGAVTLGGYIYAVGGQFGHSETSTTLSSVYRYDPGADSWTSVASMPLPLSHQHASTVVVGGEIIVIGGEVNHYQPSEVVLAYDPDQDEWRFLTSLPAGRTAGIAGYVAGEIVFSLGGSEGFSMANDTFRATLIYRGGD
jgi:N-acetylneuraminic acid mutarotase/fibronectin type 3 domain-containing protein